MALHTILFNIFASIALVSACGVIISKNPIYSLALLVLTFCNATGLLLLFRIELLAMLFIIIYVGAIAVLFLFVVMMLNIKNSDTKTESYSFSVVTKILIILPCVAIITSSSSFSPKHSLHATTHLWDDFFLYDKPWNTIVVSTTNIQAIGNVMYTYYFYYFILAGIILLIAMIGAIVLTMYKRKNAWKKQMIYRQIARNFENTITRAT